MEWVDLRFTGSRAEQCSAAGGSLCGQPRAGRQGSHAAASSAWAIHSVPGELAWASHCMLPKEQTAQPFFSALRLWDSGLHAPFLVSLLESSAACSPKSRQPSPSFWPIVFGIPVCLITDGMSRPTCTSSVTVTSPLARPGAHACGPGRRGGQRLDTGRPRLDGVSCSCCQPKCKGQGSQQRSCVLRLQVLHASHMKLQEGMRRWCTRC